MWRTLWTTVACFGLALGTAVPARAQDQPVLYRVFLTNGSSLASYGEWTRVADQLVFSLPLTPVPGPADLHLVSLPIQQIDVARTERYADALRAVQYANNRGEADFMRLSDDVARALNQVTVLNDPVERLATAERARRALADWPGAHHGYRAKEVSEIIGVLDEVISGLRAAAGGPRFDLSLTAATPVPPREPLLPNPDHAEVVEHLMTASTLVTSPTEKVSLLQSILAILQRAVGLLPEAFSARLRASALRGIAEEQKIDAAYARLRAATLDAASRFADRADVRGVDRLRLRLREQDVKLGAKRPDDVAAITATLDAHLESARRLRLQHDQWLTRIDGMRAYKRATDAAVMALVESASSLDDIRTLSGPPPQRLRALLLRLSRERRRLAIVEPPKELVEVHAVLHSAFELAENAVQLRRDAIDTADVALARQASSAAAGAMLLLSRGRDDLDAAMRPPVDTSAARPAAPRAGPTGQP